jgi:DNA-directed RNA polymerase specialized sigma24 family protein
VDDRDAVAEFGYRPLLFSIVYGMTGSVGDAEDIVQDAFVGLTRARQAGTVITDPKACLTTAVTRLGINYLHKLGHLGPVSDVARLPARGEPRVFTALSLQRARVHCSLVLLA